VAAMIQTAICDATIVVAELSMAPELQLYIPTCHYQDKTITQINHHLDHHSIPLLNRRFRLVFAE
jgi:hypothetical protein